MWSSQVLCVVLAVISVTSSAMPPDDFGFLREFYSSQENMGPPTDFLTAEKRAPIVLYRGFGPSARFFVDEGIRAVRRSGNSNQRPAIAIKNSDGNNREGIGKMACFFKLCTFRTEML